MKYNVYTVFDQVANHFFLPFYERGNNQAIGAFKQVCVAPDSIIHQFPDSYRLCKIGTFDDEGGTFENHEPEVICLATDFVTDTTENS